MPRFSHAAPSLKMIPSASEIMRLHKMFQYDSSKESRDDVSAIIHASSGERRSMDERVLNLATFREDEVKLLRAMPVCDVLHSFGSVLTSNAGSAETYKLSCHVSRIDWFISHNWSVTRFRKFMSLALYFNFRAAFGMVCVTVSICFFLQVSGVAPLLPWGAAEEEWGITSLVAPPVLTIVLVFKHELTCKKRRQPVAFLDKTCIHQTDPDLKQKGILKLGAFLGKTSQMLILYSDIYLQKLWTIYEAAVFLVIYPSHTLQVVHIDSAICFWGVLLSTFFVLLFNWLIYPLDVSLPNGWPVNELIMIVSWYAVLPAIYAIVLRRASQNFALVGPRLEEFHVQNALCFDESDRWKVEANIVDCMKWKKHVSEDASRDEALAAFNLFVRENIQQAMKASIGPSPMAWEYTAAIVFVSLFLSGFLDYLIPLMKFHGLWNLGCWLWLLNGIVNSLTFCCGIELITWMSWKCLHLSGYKNFAWTLLCAMCGSAFAFGLYISGLFLFRQFADITLFEGGLVVNSGTFFVYMKLKEGTEGWQFAFLFHGFIVLAIDCVFLAWHKRYFHKVSHKPRERLSSSESSPSPPDICELNLTQESAIPNFVEQPRAALPCTLGLRFNL